jgi:hypothetical protein
LRVVGYEAPAWERSVGNALAPLHELLGFRFSYAESYTQVIGSIGDPCDRTARYTTRPQIDIDLELDLKPPSSVYVEHGYKFCQQEALAIFAMLMVEIPCLPWEWEP